MNFCHVLDFSILKTLGSVIQIICNNSPLPRESSRASFLSDDFSASQRTATRQATDLYQISHKPLDTRLSLYGGHWIDGRDDFSTLIQSSEA